MTAEMGMFFALGLLVFPSQFGPIAVKALLLALVVALVARRVAATVATAAQAFTRSERVLLALAGLRGAVPVILATFAVIEHVPRSVEMLNIVFFAVLVSAALQGPAVSSLAARVRKRECKDQTGADSRKDARADETGRPSGWSSGSLQTARGGRASG
jgi:cell volume regulation protein A